MQRKSTIDLQGGFAEVITWGTALNGGNGLSHQIDAMFKHTNPGHAAIRLTIPKDSEGRAQTLINDYCYHYNHMVLPYTQKTLADGTEVFEVYISAWGGPDHKLVLHNYSVDLQEERRGVHFDWDPKWEREINPEKVYYEGTSSVTLQLGPQGIIHQRGNLSDAEYADYSTRFEYKLYIRELEKFELLRGKIIDILDNKKKLTGSTQVLLDRLLPNWKKDHIHKKGKTFSINFSGIGDALYQAKIEFTSNPTNQALQNKIREIAKRELTALKNNIVDDIKNWGKITPKTAERIIENKRLLGNKRIGDLIHLTQLKDKNISTLDLIDHIQEKIDFPFNSDLEDHYNFYEPRDKSLLDNAFTYGLPPDHIVQIPLQPLVRYVEAEEILKFLSPERAEKFEGLTVNEILPALTAEELEKIRLETRHGALDAEEMLKRAKQVAVTPEEFSLNSTNCAKVAGWVLYAGARESGEEDIFKREALETFATPQMIFNNALHYLKKTSKKVKKDYQDEIASQLTEEITEEEVLEKVVAVTLERKFKEISFKDIDPNLSPQERCRELMDRFQEVLENGEEIPCLTNDVKGYVEVVVKDHDDLEERFFKLCQAAIIKANEQSIKFLQPKKDENEWEVIKKIIEDENINQAQKISKNDYEPPLSYSYIVIGVNGQATPYRIGEIIGEGTSGAVKILENEHGERLAVKILEDKPALQDEVYFAQKMNALVANFTRARERKYSKALQKEMGDKHYVVQPLYEGNELAKLVKQKTFSPLQKLELAKKCAEAIQRMHDKNILHRDIKGANFIASVNEETKKIDEVNVIDFGSAIETDVNGKVIAPPQGTPLYIAPELGREALLKASDAWNEEARLAQRYGNLIAEAYDQIQLLETEERKMQGVVWDNSLKYLFEPSSREKYYHYFRAGVDEEILKILNQYDGSNEEAILNIILADDTQNKKSYLAQPFFKAPIKKYLNAYFEQQKKVLTLGDEIAFYENKIDEYNQIVDDAKAEMERLDEHIDSIFFGTSIENSFALDVYSLGVMFKKEFGLDLSALGLSGMLDEDKELRRTLPEVITILDDALKNVESHGIESIPTPTIRVPNRINPEDLHETATGELCILSKDELEEVKKLPRDPNAIVNITCDINGNKVEKKIYFTREGGAFVLVHPIHSKPHVATLLVQNIDDYSWSILKEAKGSYEFINQLPQFHKEKNVLTDLNQLQGAIDLTDKTKDILHRVHIQPYAYGKTYADIITAAKIDGVDIALEDALLMILKAIESLKELHERQYLHRDIEPQNMIWDAEYERCTLIGFDYAKKGKGDDLVVQDINFITKEDAKGYQAPEIEFDKGIMKEDREYNMQTDIYSLGIVVKEVLACVKPSDDDVYLRLKELEATLTDNNPINRPTTSNALNEIRQISQLFSSLPPPSVKIFADDTSKTLSPIVEESGEDDLTMEDVNKEIFPEEISIEEERELNIKIDEPGVEHKEFPWMQRFEKVRYEDKGRIVSGDRAIYLKLVNDFNPYPYLLIRKHSTWQHRPEWYLYYLNDQDKLVARSVDHDPSLSTLKDILKHHSFDVVTNKFKYKVQVEIDTYFHQRRLLAHNEEARMSYQPKTIQKIYSTSWDHSQSIKRQANYIWKKHIKPLIVQGKKVALLCPSNEKDAQSIYAAYLRLDASLSGVFTADSDLSHLFKELVALIKKENYRDQVHFLPIPSSLEKGNVNDPDNKVSLRHLNASLKNIAEHKGAGFTILSLADNENNYILDEGKPSVWNKAQTIFQFNEQTYQEQSKNTSGKPIAKLSQKRYMLNHLDRLSSGTVDYLPLQSAYEFGTENPERLSLFKDALTTDLYQHLVSQQSNATLMRQLVTVAKQYEAHGNKEIFWNKIVKLCKSEVNSPWKWNSLEMNLFLRSIAEFDTNLKFWPHISSIDQLIIAQQKRDFIENDIKKEIKRLTKESTSFDADIALKIDAYRILIKEIQKSDKNMTLSTLLLEINPIMLQKRDDLTYKGRAVSIEQALTLNRGLGFREAASKRMLNSVRNQLTKTHPKTIWQKMDFPPLMEEVPEVRAIAPEVLVDLHPDLPSAYHADEKNVKGGIPTFRSDHVYEELNYDIGPAIKIDVEEEWDEIGNEQEEHETLNIVTANMLGGTQDGAYCDTSIPEAMPESKEHIAMREDYNAHFVNAVIEKRNPDLIMIQENTEELENKILKETSDKQYQITRPIGRMTKQEIIGAHWITLAHPSISRDDQESFLPRFSPKALASTSSIYELPNQKEVSIAKKLVVYNIHADYSNYPYEKEDNIRDILDRRMEAILSEAIGECIRQDILKVEDRTINAHALGNLSRSETLSKLEEIPAFKSIYQDYLKQASIEVCVFNGDWNANIAPRDNEPKNICTTIGHIDRHPDRIQGAKFPDGGFSAYIDPNTGEYVIRQAKNTPLNSLTGLPFEEEELSPIATENLDPIQAKEINKQQMIMCLDDDYKKARLFADKTIFEYEKDLREKFQDNLKRPTLFFRVTKNMNNEPGFGLSLDNQWAKNFQEFCKKAVPEFLSKLQFNYFNENENAIVCVEEKDKEMFNLLLQQFAASQKLLILNTLIRGREEYVANKSLISFKDHRNDFDRLIEDVHHLYYKPYENLRLQANDIINVIQEAFLKEARKHSSIGGFVEKLYQSTDDYQYPRFLMEQLKKLYSDHPEYPFKLKAIAEIALFSTENLEYRKSNNGLRTEKVEDILYNLQVEHNRVIKDFNKDDFKGEEAYEKLIAYFNPIYRTLLQVSGQDPNKDKLLKEMEQFKKVNKPSESPAKINLALFGLILAKAQKDKNSVAAFVLTHTLAYYNDQDINNLTVAIYDEAQKRKSIFSAKHFGLFHREVVNDRNVFDDLKVQLGNINIAPKIEK